MATPTSTGRPSISAAKTAGGMLSPPAAARPSVSPSAAATSTTSAASTPSLARGVSTVGTTGRTFQPGPPSAPPPSIPSSNSNDSLRGRPASSPANGTGASGTETSSGSGDAFMNRLAKLGGVEIKSSTAAPSTPSNSNGANGSAGGDDDESIRKREHQRMIIGMMGEEAANAEEKKFQLLEREELKIPQFSAALETAIQEVVGGESALDRPQFDAVDYINAEFPDEKSLTGAKLDATLTLQRQHMLTLSETIAKEVRDHSTAKSRTKKAIKSATNSIKDLVSKIKHIKEKADESEKMVLQISTDLRSLDCAKKHLTRASQALRNLHMLTSLSSLLESAINEKRYRDAAGQMQGVTVVVTEFEKYKDVANIRALISHVELMKERVRTQITKDFYNMGVPGPDGKPSINAPLLLDACAVLDALGGDAKASILKWFCKSQLESYQKEYRPGSDAGMLENIANRYALCIDLLDRYDRTYMGVFPRQWDVPAILAREFSIITRDHLTILLKQNQPEVEIFRQIVGKTVDFETTMCLKFREAKIGEVSIHFEGSDDKKATINALKMKYKKAAAEAAASSSSTPSGTAGESKDDKKHVSNIVFEHIISEVFTPYMAILVEWEKQKVDQLISKWRSDEKWPEAKADSAPGALRLTSSNELFLYIRNSIKRITKLARDQTFFHMFRVYRSGISSYVDMLDGRLPARGPTGRNEEKPCGRGELQQMCVIVNTAEYCYDTLPPFGESVRKQVDDVFKNDVDLEQQRQEFNELIGKVLNALANSVSLRLSRAFTTMLAIKWSIMDSTGDQSSYITEIQQSLLEDVAFIGSHIVARKHAIFCSSWVRQFVPKFVESIFKIKGITEMGGNQLLIDVTVLRRILLEAPFVGMSEEVKKPSQRAFMLFNKYVNEEMLKVENLLKVINSPNERIVLRFKTMLTHMKPDDLAKIMAVKGLKKPYMVQLINDYNKGVPETERLVVAQVLPPSTGMSRLGAPFAGIKFP